MVRYYGRARQRIGSVNTNQLGLKMSGCPSRVGRNPVLGRYIGQRVNCMNGLCNPISIHGIYRKSNKLRNNTPFCKHAADNGWTGGVGHIYAPRLRFN